MARSPLIGHLRGFGSRVALAALLAAGPGTADLAAAAEGSSDEAREIKELLKRLDERDAVIRNLQQRVERLEREQAGRAAAPRPPAAEAAPPPRAKTARPEPASAPSPAGEAAPKVAQQAPPARPRAAGKAAAPNGGPGEFTVSPEAAERALERALVQTGAALLAPWTVELVPGLTYQHNQVSQPGQITLTTGGAVLITENVVRTTQLEASALLRVGLPWDAQAEIRLPYDYKSLSTTARVGGLGLTEQTRDGTGFGDLSLALTKQLMTEKEWLPSLFVSGVWDSNTGQTVKGVALGTGFDEFKVGLLATKRQDPLVYTAGFSYQTSLDNHGISPGDVFTPSVGLLFAVSPETSLQFSQQLSFARPLRINHQQIAGSDQLSGIFNVGLLTILGPGLVLNFNAGIGETPDAPNLTLQVSMPIRLN